MDLDAMAEWSRYVVAGAIIVYLAAWAAYGSEFGARARLRRSMESEAALDRERPEPARVGVPAGAGGDASPPPAGPAVPTVDVADEQVRADTLGRVGRALTLVATVVLAAGVVMRGVGTSRVPWGNMYEFSITGALVASVAFLFLARTQAGRAVAGWIVLLVFVVLGLAVTVLYVPPGPLTPALRHYWLVIHVGAAVVAFGLFTVSAAVNVLQILSERAERSGRRTGLGAALPASGMLDRLAYRLTAVAFPIWTFGPLILGAVWAEVSWGRYWGWDPKEVWALVTWLAYAGYLHARATAGWKGSKASVVALIGYATVLFSYFGVNIFFNGLHAYGGL